MSRLYHSLFARLRWVIFLLTVIVLGTDTRQILAAERRETITVFSPIECKAWLADRKREKRKGDFDSFAATSNKLWLNGFLTGLNVADTSGKDILHAVDSETAALWIDRYCTQNPTSTVTEAATYLFIELRKLETATPASASDTP
jgi:hypothetical protein